MKLILIPFKESDLTKAFELYKSELRSFVEASFGWDEGYQQKRFSEKYSLDWFSWIECEGDIIGYVCYDLRAAELHISLLIIHKEVRGKGIGMKIMDTLNDLARDKNLKLTLSSFKNNKSAVSFYQKLGFKIINQDDCFFDFEMEEN